QALTQDPAQIDVASRGGECAIPHVRDVSGLAVGAEGDLAEIVTVDRDRLDDFPRSRVDDRDLLRPRVADDQPRLVRRKRNPPRLTTDRQTSRDLATLNIYPRDLVARSHSDECRGAISGDGHSARFRTNLDPAR